MHVKNQFCISQEISKVTEVEQYWQRIADKTGDHRKWQDLTPNQQQAIIHSINILLGVLHGRIP